MSTGTTNATDRAALALRTYFALLGVVSGTWMALIPSFRAHWGLSLEALGWVLLCIGLGSVSAYPLAHAGLPRWGSARVSAWSASGLALAAGLAVSAPSLPIAVLALYGFGVCAGVMDAAINTQAVTQEGLRGRSLMAGMHGFYSLGNLLAGLWVSVAMAWGVSATWLMSLVVVPALLLSGAMHRKLLTDRALTSTATAPAHVRVAWTRPLLLLGVLIVAAYVTEGALLDWGGVYLRLHAGATLVQAPWAFTAFSAAMVVGRFMGDRVIQAWGPAITLQRCGALVFVGVAMALVWPRLSVVVVAFALAGLGLSVVVPILFSLTGQLNPGDGGRSVAKVGVMGYAGVLAGPALIGWVAQRVGLSLALLLLLGLAALIWRMAAKVASPKLNQGL